jgi:septation ring formation regulator EzrA
MDKLENSLTSDHTKTIQLKQDTCEEEISNVKEKLENSYESSKNEQINTL